LKSVINMLLRRSKVNRAFYKEKRNQNYASREMPLKNEFLALTPIIILFLITITSVFCLSEENSTDFEFVFNFLANDTLAVYIWPPAESISVNCDTSKANSFRIALFSNETQYNGMFSLIYMMPRYKGKYDLMISFSLSKTWNSTIGVYTNDIEFYQSAGSSTYTPQGYFIKLQTIKVSPKNNATTEYTIRIILLVYERNSSMASLFNFPPPVNLGLFIAVCAGVAYFDSFFFIDLYFKSKRESMSKSRWVLIGLLLLVSFFIIHQSYILLSGD